MVNRADNKGGRGACYIADYQDAKGGLGLCYVADNEG